MSWDRTISHGCRLVTSVRSVSRAPTFTPSPLKAVSVSVRVSTSTPSVTVYACVQTFWV